MSAVDEWKEPCVYELISGVYGQANAPRLWYMEVKRRLLENGWEQHTLDPCLFMRRRRDADTGEMKLVGIVGFHVDDMILGCARDEFGLNVKNEMHALFEWGSEWKHNEFTFCGRLLKHDPEAGTIHLSQAAYISDIDVHSLRSLDPTAKLTPVQLSDFRSGVGSLQWVASMTRPDIAADTSLLQKSPSELTVADLSEVHRVLRYLKATPSAGITMNRVLPDDLILVPYSDASWANAPNQRSQAGMLVLATSRRCLEEQTVASVLEWKSHRLRRVCRSTLAAEACSLDAAVDHCAFFAFILCEIFDPEFKGTRDDRPWIPVAPTTDCRSLYDAVRKLSTQFQERRTQIDVTAIRETCARTIRWVPTTVQRADGLTKRDPKLRNELRMFVESPTVELIETEPADDET